MRLTMDVTVKSRLPEIARQIGSRLSLVVRKTAFDIEKAAKQRAPVDTGALRASIHAVTDHEDHYATAIAEVSALNASAVTFPEVKPAQPFTAIVAVAVEYGLYVEQGTTSTPARPFFRPAIEAARRPFEQAVGQALKDASR